MTRQTNRKNRPGTRDRSATQGVTPHRLLGVALGFFLLGILLGWFGHAIVSNSREVVRHEPQPAAAPQNSLMQERLAQIEGHIASLEAQVTSGPLDGGILRDLGNMYYDLGEVRDRTGDHEGAHVAFDRAIDRYRAAASAGVESADMFTDLGTMQFRSGQPTEALASYGRALEIAPDHANAWLNIGVVRAQATGDAEGAVQAWRRYLELAPDGPEADRVRAMIRTVERETTDG